MPDVAPQFQQQQKKGFFEKMSLFQKILLFGGVIVLLFVAVMVFFGGITSFYQFFFYLIIFCIVGVFLYIVIKATGMIFAPKFFSPRENLFGEIKRMAIDYKPDNLGSLFFIGDKGKKRVCAGKITGCIVLPYYTGKIKKDKQGKVIYEKVDDADDTSPKIPKYEDIRANADGDTFFSTVKGMLFWKQTHYIRCHRDLHSTLNGDVEIYDINPIPYGNFEYPYKQIQENISQIMIQNQIETIIATHEHQHDLISQSVDSAIFFNPVMRFEMKRKAELGDEE